MQIIVIAIMLTKKATGIKPSHSNWRLLVFIDVLLFVFVVSLFKGEYAGGVKYVSLVAKYFQTSFAGRPPGSRKPVAQCIMAK
jgi:hypothetical protein